MKEIIYKKCWPPYFQDVLDGSKNFEVRLGNFSARPGDLLVFEEYLPPGAGDYYTGRVVGRVVTYAVHTKDFTFWPAEEIQEHGFIVMGLRPPDFGEDKIELEPLPSGGRLR